MIMNLEKADAYLELLNKHFKTEGFEKHPRAMMDLLFQRGKDAVLGKNFNKKRISQRKQAKLYEHILTKLQNCYGRWVNLSDFKVKDDRIRFRCNLAYAYKNVLGVIYAPTNVSTAKDILYTSHCFERFEERADERMLSSMYFYLEKSKNTRVNAADVLFIMVNMCNFEYAVKDRFCFLNTQLGVLVLEDYDDLFIAKTFLSPEMADLTLQWYKPKIDPKDIATTWLTYKTLREIMTIEKVPIKAPLFGIESLVQTMENQPEEAADELDD